jgi:hypothetical protein
MRDGERTMRHLSPQETLAPRHVTDERPGVNPDAHALTYRVCLRTSAKAGRGLPPATRPASKRSVTPPK